MIRQRKTRQYSQLKPARRNSLRRSPSYIQQNKRHITLRQTRQQAMPFHYTCTCSNGENCELGHPPSCIHFKKGTCTTDTCKFVHNRHPSATNVTNAGTAPTGAYPKSQATPTANTSANSTPGASPNPPSQRSIAVVVVQISSAGQGGGGTHCGHAQTTPTAVTKLRYMQCQSCTMCNSTSKKARHTHH